MTEKPSIFPLASLTDKKLEKSSQENGSVLYDFFRKISSLPSFTKTSVQAETALKTNALKPQIYAEQVEIDMLRVKMISSLKACNLQVPKELLFASPIEEVEKEKNKILLRQKISLPNLRKVVVLEGQFERKGRRSYPLKETFQFHVYPQ